ncbi:hypothetical protein [Dysgonomonas sp. ZJ709]|uniref:hypothetical protein n=1 Tax=Dysgonomonas sp. ZJ709 TaxID=2709797 RepID=UPI0013ED4288|nr:hypothetical protein [Dysgonomonas sp. ZJ709]
MVYFSITKWTTFQLYYTIKELTDLLLNDPILLIDYRKNKFKILVDTLTIGRNNPTDNDCITYISFDAILINSKGISDVDKWMADLSNSKLEIRL